MSERTDRLAAAFAALDGGDVGGFRDLFHPDAQWLGVPGRGPNGETPT
jgi:ketosteroid isomerase-like protein